MINMVVLERELNPYEKAIMFCKNEIAKMRFVVSSFFFYSSLINRIIIHIINAIYKEVKLTVLETELNSCERGVVFCKQQINK